MQTKALEKLNKEIINCEKCERLIPYIKEVGEKKVKRFREWDYWAKPVPGFGDPFAEVLIIGLAPAAHGANRTGRMFTGDSSGDWLYKALYETGFASQPDSTASDDGLTLTNVYIAAVGRCAPPQNKLLTSEIENCLPFLEKELELLENVKVILCLGGLAFNRYRRLRGLKGLKFAHGNIFHLEDETILISSYHPSRQNTNTGKLKWDAWLKVFSTIEGLVSR